MPAMYSSGSIHEIQALRADYISIRQFTWEKIMKFNRTLFKALGLTTVGLAISTLSVASNAWSNKDLKGCYSVKKIDIAVASAGLENVIGTYKMVLKPVKGKGVVVLAGPVSGSEAAGSHAGEQEDHHEEDGHQHENEEHEEHEEHGGHILGTYHRDGVLITVEDSVTVTSTDCFDDNGQPRLIVGKETLNFTEGTGIFKGIESGFIELDVTFDSCTDPENPVADLQARSGSICFAN